MLKTCLRSSEPFDRADSSRVKGYRTPMGELFLRTCCSSAFVEKLEADEGLRAFARLPEREYELLLGIAGRGDSMLALAYTETGKIVGQVTLAPLSDWWKGLSPAYEVAVEVSSGWRQMGIAHALLSQALAFENVEEYLIVGCGFSWHWDYEGLGLSRFEYRELIARLFAAHGFAEYLTSEPNIRMDPANILVARLGSQLESKQIHQFFTRLLSSETLPGL
ncbi:MAG TPA: GNAT family N-acetyltransferase [Ktedonobacteraceae bacterium]|nr:GNAT family N-acetyltransferase [Ktedonobacteraceae bacterium]